MKSVEVLTEQFRARGLRVTPQRQAIFGALSSSMVHPTAEAIYATVSVDMPTISLRTVYQTLNDLTAMGELSTLDIGTGSTRFDPNLEPHHHLVCDECGRIDDVHAEFPGVAVPRRGSKGFQVASTQIVFRGRCADCAPPTGRPNHHVPTNPAQESTMPEIKGSKTEENLKEAFAGESQANRRYLYFAQKADVEGYPDVAALFRSVAEGETGHAFGHFDFLASAGDPVTGEPVGSTEDNLRSAIAGETYEYTEMYPGFAKTARDEGFEEVAEWLETLARAEKSHAGRFTQGLEHVS